MFTKLFTLQVQKDSVVWLYVKPVPGSVATSLLQSGLLLDFTQQRILSQLVCETYFNCGNSIQAIFKTGNQPPPHRICSSLARMVFKTVASLDITGYWSTI